MRCSNCNRVRGSNTTVIRVPAFKFYRTSPRAPHTVHSPHSTPLGVEAIRFVAKCLFIQLTVCGKSSRWADQTRKTNADERREKRGKTGAETETDWEICAPEFSRPEGKVPNALTNNSCNNQRDWNQRDARKIANAAQKVNSSAAEIKSF